MGNEKTLYISDLDGTLLDNNANLSEQTSTLINSLINQGVLFSIATARTYATVNHILANLNINLPIILCNGVMLYDKLNKKIVSYEKIAQNSFHLILTTLKEKNVSGFLYTTYNGKMMTWYEHFDNEIMKNFYLERKTKFNKPFTQIDNFYMIPEYNNPIYFCIGNNYETLNSIYQILQSDKNLNLFFYKDIYNENSYYLEIASSTASKKIATDKLRQLTNATRVIAFGDNNNDKPLFEAADECYAVANAVDSIKRIATGIIGSNSDCAVAKFIEQRECCKKD